MLIAVLVILVATFYLATLRKGHDWGGDFALYIMHAKNLVEGRPYAETGYIYNPSWPLEPRTYPPGFPLLLAPVYRIFGLNLTAMKVENILIFNASLVLITFLFWRSLSFYQLLILITLIGFSPPLWDSKDQVMSDIPFLCFSILSLLLLQRAPTADASLSKKALWAIGTATSIYVSTATRPIGFVLLITVIVYDLIRFRRLRPISFAVATVFLAAYGMQKALLDSGGPYFVLYHGYSLLRPLRNAGDYIVHFSKFWDNGYIPPLRAVVFGGSAILGALGYRECLRRSISHLEIFLPTYMAVLVFWMGHTARYLIPVIPAYFYYVLRGTDCIRPVRRFSAFQIKGVLIAVALVTYLARYSTMNFGPLRIGVALPASQDIFQYVREHTATNDVFMFVVAPTFALYTGRSTSPPHKTSDQQLLQYFKKINVKYVALEPRWSEQLRGLIRRQPDDFTLVYTNSDFQLYRFVD